MLCDACKKPLKINFEFERVFRTLLKPSLAFCSKSCLRFAFNVSIEDKWEKVKETGKA